jgi:hypothetical protein
MQTGKEKRQGRSGMAKDLDPRNKEQPTQGVRAGIKLATAPESISSRYILKPESSSSAAAMSAVRHNPKARQEEKKPARDRLVPPSPDQVNIASLVRGQEGGFFFKNTWIYAGGYGQFWELSLMSSSQISRVYSEALYGQSPPGAIETFPSKQVMDTHKNRK